MDLRAVRPKHFQRERAPAEADALPSCEKPNVRLKSFSRRTMAPSWRFLLYAGLKPRRMQRISKELTAFLEHSILSAG